VKSGQGATPTGYPQPDSGCASQVRPMSELRSDNTTANNTTPSGTVSWGTGLDSLTLWPADRSRVTGQYTGTTDDIFQWAACKWGHDEDLLRAVAAQESWWHESEIGDKCGGDGSNGVGSYGIMQIKNLNCSGGMDNGGWPDTQNETALNVDFYGAYIRACVDGAFQGWLYDGTSVANDISSHESWNDSTPITGDPGQDYVLWGCVGNWYSGGWWDSGAQSYISPVQGYFTNKPWLQSGF
jgi:hypothetical protein